MKSRTGQQSLWLSIDEYSVIIQIIIKLCSNYVQIAFKLRSDCLRVYKIYYSQQQNALGYNLSMQGVGDVVIDGPRLEEFFRSRKDFFEVS